MDILEGSIILLTAVFEHFTYEMTYAMKPKRKARFPIYQRGYMVWIYSGLNLNKNIILDMKPKYGNE